MFQLTKTALVTAALFVTTAACMPEPIDFGAFPAEDEPGVVAEVSKEEASEVAEIALQGLNDGDFAAWTTRWDEAMLDAIGEDAWLDYRADYLARYGQFVEIEETRLTAGADPAYVRFSFLAAFEEGHLMMVHVYPVDGTEIAGVHLRDPQTGEAP